MAEFALIDRLSDLVAAPDGRVELGIGDDAAVLLPGRGEALVAATDTLNEGIHFFAGTDPAALGHKLLAVNLSDLAAMGAEPRWALLNLSLPEFDSAWVDDFGRGFARLADRYGVRLVGGDTCAGPCSLSLTLLGAHSPGQAIRRSTAQVGDHILVSGVLGDAARALELRLRGDACDSGTLADALDRPEPRVALGAGLRGLATACIDVSDGLLADLGHLARASGVGASLSLSALPCSEAVGGLADSHRWDLQLCGGEDYELCFTVGGGNLDAVLALGEALGVPLAVIGEITEATGVHSYRPDGALYQPDKAPWEHFSGPGASGSDAGRSDSRGSDDGSSDGEGSEAGESAS